MANTITKQTLLDGSKRLIVKIDFDLVDGDETRYVMINASDYDPPFTNCRVEKIDADLSGFSAELEWDADSPVPLMTLAEGESRYCAGIDAGIINNAGDGRTGDILITSHISSGYNGTIIIHIVKKGV